MNIKKLRPTAEQVNEWFAKNGVGRELIAINDFIDHYEIRWKTKRGDVFDITSDDQLYIEIISQPTTFAHALECMQKEKLVFSTGIEGEYYIFDQEEHNLYYFVDDDWTFCDEILNSLISEDWYLRLDINWETGEIK